MNFFVFEEIGKQKRDLRESRGVKKQNIKINNNIIGMHSVPDFSDSW